MVGNGFVLQTRNMRTGATFPLLIPVPPSADLGVLVHGRAMRHLGVIPLRAAWVLSSPSKPRPSIVMSIKKSDPPARAGGGRTMPDGTTVITNQPIRRIFGRAAAQPVREIENVSDWAMEFYDITVKPPAGARRPHIGCVNAGLPGRM